MIINVGFTTLTISYQPTSPTMILKQGYGACSSAALSAFLKVANGQFSSSSCETP